MTPHRPTNLTLINYTKSVCIKRKSVPFPFVYDACQTKESYTHLSLMALINFLSLFLIHSNHLIIMVLLDACLWRWKAKLQKDWYDTLKVDLYENVCVCKWIAFLCRTTKILLCRVDDTRLKRAHRLPFIH